MLHEGWPFSIIQSANTAYNPDFNTTPKRLRPKIINPDPQIPQWPKPEWPKELQDLCLEFGDVLVEELEEAMNNESSKNRDKYLKIRKANLHKMEPIPVCKIPN